MKTIYYIAAISALTLVACKKENLEVKKVDHSKMHATNGEKLNVAVVNEEDPICGMKTAQFLKDTLTYNKKLYGFCGTHCKEAFKKEPKKYIKK